MRRNEARLIVERRCRCRRLSLLAARWKSILWRGAAAVARRTSQSATRRTTAALAASADSEWRTYEAGSMLPRSDGARGRDADAVTVSTAHAKNVLEAGVATALEVSIAWSRDERAARTAGSCRWRRRSPVLFCASYAFTWTRGGAQALDGVRRDDERLHRARASRSSAASAIRRVFARRRLPAPYLRPPWPCRWVPGSRRAVPWLRRSPAASGFVGGWWFGLAGGEAEAQHGQAGGTQQ